MIAAWGAGLALVAALSGEVVAGQGLLSVRWRPDWLRELEPALVAVVVDFLIIIRAFAVAMVIGRQRLGTFRQDRSAAGLGELPAGRRAWVTLVATWSPNCYVLDIDPETGRRTVHDLDLHAFSFFFELMSVAGYALSAYRVEQPDVLQGSLTSRSQ